MSKTLKILLSLFAAVIILGGAATYYFGFYTTGTKEAVKDSVKETQQEDSSDDSSTKVENSEYSNIIAYGPSFIFALRGPIESNTNSFSGIIYDLADKSTNNKEILLDYPLLSSSSESSSANDSVQWSTDSRVMAYAYGDEGGMDAPEVPNSFSLIAINYGVKQTVVSGLEVAQVPKWLLTPNGKEIYYIKASSTDESAEYSLNKYDVNTQKTTVVASGFDKSYATGGSEIFISGDESKIYIITSKSVDNYSTLYRLTFDLSQTEDYVYSDGAMAPGLNNSRSFMGSYSSSDVVVSPDGEMIAYRYKISATKHGVSIYNVKSKTSTDIYEPEENRSINGIKWSPDSKSIAFETTYFGTGEMTSGNLSLVKVDIASKQSAVIDSSSSSSSNTGFIRTLAWSQDSKKLAYTKELKIYYYDFDSSKSNIIYSSTSSDFNLKGLSWVSY
ncbi:MAG: hypothetical protein BWY19_00981 [bacterium ADurb.Bin212]|nr:MAG: hypothetical protein BWY19_00981 [bacterium ADurb.Bin212]